jgi:hypothetical protein
MKFALIFTFLFEAMWASIPLVPSIFLRNVHGALNLVLVIAWAALIVPLGVAAVSKLMQPLYDQDLDAFMSFRRRD